METNKQKKNNLRRAVRIKNDWFIHQRKHEQFKENLISQRQVQTVEIKMYKKQA